MKIRAQLGEDGEVALPRELFEGEAPAEGTVMEVRRNEQGDVVLRPVAIWPVGEYTDEDLETFAQHDELTPELEDRLNTLIAREPRPFRR